MLPTHAKEAESIRAASRIAQIQKHADGDRDAGISLDSDSTPNSDSTPTSKPTPTPVINLESNSTQLQQPGLGREIAEGFGRENLRHG